LLGAALGEGESASGRFRAVELTVLGTPRDARGTEHDAPWPVRCASYSDGVADHASVLGADAIDLATATRALGKELRADVNATADLGKLVEQVWKAGRAANLVGDGSKEENKPANPGGAPKPTVPVLAVDALAAPGTFRGDFDLRSVKVDPAPSANLRFLIDDGKLANGAVVCGASGVPTTLACDRAPSEVAVTSPGLSLMGTTDPNAFPWVFAGDRGQLGVYAPSGTVALRGEPIWGASVDAEDTAWLLVHLPGAGPNELGLIRAPRTGDVPKATPVLDATELTHAADATLAWRWLIDVTGPRARVPHHLLARTVDPQGELGAPVDIGDVSNLAEAGSPESGPRFSVCADGNHIAVRVHGAKSDALAFYTGVAWTTPVALAALGGNLACEANEAVVTALTNTDSAPAIVQARCNAAGCKELRIAISDLLSGTDVLPHTPGNVGVAELDGKLLLLWNAGTLGGLRMRLATPGRLKATADVVLIDTKEAKKSDTITDIRLVGGSPNALLFVQTLATVRVFSVDGSSNVVPLSSTL
jgi:hypothetical protein